MRYRTPGRTGIQVSPSCLGAMMFGAMGNADHDEVLDRIDEIVAPGTDASPLPHAYGTPPLAEPRLRRRPATERTAA